MRLMAAPEDALALVVRFCEERIRPGLSQSTPPRVLRAGRRDHHSRVASAVEPGPRHRVDSLSGGAAPPHAQGGTWTLYWRGSDERWHAYEDTKPSRDVQPLLAEIEADPTGIFWG